MTVVAHCNTSFARASGSRKELSVLAPVPDAGHRPLADTAESHFILTLLEMQLELPWNKICKGEIHQDIPQLYSFVNRRTNFSPLKGPHNGQFYIKLCKITKNKKILWKWLFVVKLTNVGPYKSTSLKSLTRWKWRGNCQCPNFSVSWWTRPRTSKGSFTNEFIQNLGAILQLGNFSHKNSPNL